MNEFSRYYVELFKYIWQDTVFFFQEIIWKGIIIKFFENIGDYYGILVQEADEFTVVSWLMLILSTLLNFSLILFLIARIIIWGRKYLSFRRIELEKNELIEEIANLNDRVLSLVDEKNQILALKVSQLGINAASGQSNPQMMSAPMQTQTRTVIQPTLAGAGAGNTTVVMQGGGGTPVMQSSSSQAPQQAEQAGPSRFIKLINVDKEYAGKDTTIYMEESDFVSLPALVTRFVNFAAFQLKLYYTPKMIMLFFSAMAASKVIILQGISGTGKTSLPYAMAKFFNNQASIISVQPSWRDRAEILGYLNEFTKRFNETDFLKALYEATYRKDINFIVLDEMNLARIEYYFAEFLSILEMPDPSEWKIDLVPDSRSSDPLKVVNGKISVSQNVWFIGTANKDDSTFTITDKV
ncbi:MAG: hypothetical protein U1C51_03900, partial [Candidatus Izemoplasmatales bacterium]|nr:hypothetical protein [Candidatus Izemoplasmatales bacterium]